MSASQPIEWTVAQLAQAVERGQLELHYQPIVDLRSEQIVGAEALLRWRHPTLGLLPPGQFLPVIESSGLMPEIGAWVLGAACRQMRDWRVLAWQPFRLAVNVAASQVGPDFDKWVKGVLADAGLPAAYLEIELTESVAFGEVQAITTAATGLTCFIFRFLRRPQDKGAARQDCPPSLTAASAGRGAAPHIRRLAIPKKNGQGAIRDENRLRIVSVLCIISVLIRFTPIRYRRSNDHGTSGHYIRASRRRR